MERDAVQAATAAFGAVAETGQKGGVIRGNGGEVPRRPRGQVVPVPAGLLRRMRTMNSECVKLLLCLVLYQWEVGRIGAVASLKQIADGAGLSPEMAEAWLLGLAEDGWVEQTARGFRLRTFPAEEWDDDA